MTKTLTQRIALTGGDEIKKELESLGAAGKKAFSELEKAAKDLNAVKTGGFLKSIADAQRQLKSLSTAVGAAGVKLRNAGAQLSAALSLPAAAIGTASVKAFSDFEAAIGNVGTLVDETTESLADMGAEVLNISARVPVPILDLANSLYDVRSAGIAAADQMKVLEGSARLAVAGLGTTGQAVNLVTSSINAFGLAGAEQARVYDLIFTAIKTGKTTLDGLSQGFGGVAGTVANANVHIDEFLAATAALTTTGLPAATAYTQIRAAIAGLTRESDESIEVFEKLGVKTLPELINKSGGLVNAFGRIRQAVGGSDARLLKLLGSTEALNAVLGLTGAQGQAFADALAAMRDDINEVDAAFEKQRETMARTFQDLRNAIDGARIALGAEMAPAVKDVVAGLRDAVAGFQQMSPEVRKWSAIIVGAAAVVGPLVAGLGILAIAVSALLTPIGLVIAALALIAGAAAYLALRQTDAERAARNHADALAEIDKAVENVKAGTEGAAEKLDELAEKHYAAAEAAAFDAQEQVIAAQKTLESLNSITKFLGGADSILGGAFDSMFSEAQRREIDELVAKREAAIARLDAVRFEIGKARFGQDAGFKDLATDAENAARKVDQLAESASRLPRVFSFSRTEGIDALFKRAGDEADKTKRKTDEASKSVTDWSDHIRRVPDALRDAQAPAADAAQALQTLGDAAEAIPGAIVPAVDQAGGALASMPAIADQTAAGVDNAFSGLASAIGSEFNAVVSSVRSSMSSLESSVRSVINRLVSELNKLRAAIAAAASAASSSSSSTGGSFAAGGYVRGPGTGTSDSIPARLSNGEYVIRAKAVDHYGLALLNLINSVRLPKGFMDELRGFARGGLVSLAPSPVPAFAAGGLVQGGGVSGRPVILNMPTGETFDLIAPDEVADRLLQFATGQTRRRAGKRPGWYGAK